MSTGLTQFIGQLAPGELEEPSPPEELDSLTPPQVSDPEQPGLDPPPEMDGRQPDSDVSADTSTISNPIDGVTTPGTGNCRYYCRINCDTTSPVYGLKDCIITCENAEPVAPGYAFFGPYATGSECMAACLDATCPPPPPPTNGTECPPGTRPVTSARRRDAAADTGSSEPAEWYLAKGWSEAEHRWLYFCTTDGQLDPPIGYAACSGPYGKSTCQAMADWANSHPGDECGDGGSGGNGNGKTCEPVPTETLKWYRIVCINDCYDIIKDICVECSKVPKGRANVCVFGPYDSETSCKSKTLTICDLLECVGEPGGKGTTQPPPTEPTTGQPPTNGGDFSGTESTPPTLSDVC